MDTAAYNALPRQSLYGDGGKSEADALEGIPKIDLKPFCPRPRSQGKHGSCTAWSTGYAAMTIAYAVQVGAEQSKQILTDSAFSALFLYNQTREDFTDCGQGTYIHNALKLLKEKGNLRGRDFDSGNNCRKLPTDEDFDRATPYRIKDWMTLFESGSSSRVRIDKTKLSLAAQKPVIIAMRTRNNFSELGANDKFWLPTVGDTALSYYHAMTVIGFDDGKGAFEVMNSWGEEWGNKGFFWLRYEDYARHVPNAYQMTLFPPGSKPKTVTKPTEDLLTAALTVRVPKGVRDGEILFENAVFDAAEGGLSILQGPSWPVDKQFQIVASDMAGGSYLYAFSVDAANQIKVHWPRDGKFDDKFEGLNESAVVTNSKVRIIIPDPQTVLFLEKPGDEYLCILLAKSPLPNFNTLLQNVQKNPEKPLLGRLNKALGKDRISETKTTRTAGGTRASSSDALGNVVPIVLKIPVRTQ